MNFKLLRYISVFCIAVSLIGCEPKEVEPVVDPNAPPPPTAQQIAQKIVFDAQLDMPIPPPNTRFPTSVRTSLLQVLRTAKNQNAVDPVGKEALEHVVGRLDRRIREFREAKAWQHVMVFLDAHAIFKPDSRKYASLREEAIIELRKPQVMVTGLHDMQGRELIMLNMYVPLTDSRYKEKVQVGDEIHGLRVVDIFGENRGVTLEYLETGEKFVAYLKSAR